jgi:hypothetical protein
MVRLIIDDENKKVHCDREKDYERKYFLCLEQDHPCNLALAHARLFLKEKSQTELNELKK